MKDFIPPDIFTSDIQGHDFTEAEAHAIGHLAKVAASLLSG